MNESGFFKWLSVRYSPSTVRARITNCRTVEKVEGDLDGHFKRDGGESLLVTLTYAKEDEREGRNPKHRIPINGSIYNGTATLKGAVKLYFEYLGGKEGIGIARVAGNVAREKRVKRDDWPKWKPPEDEELYELVRLTARYAEFLLPEIVEGVVRDNSRHRIEWSEALLGRGVDPDIYLWDGSPCAFPGVRRYAGSKEMAFFRKHTELPEGIPDAVQLDDNDFPKQLWSFVFRKRPFHKYPPLSG